MLPLSLYIHAPWCIQKCHYCDFNSHAQQDSLPEEQYLQALLTDFRQDVAKFGKRKIHSIFIGGGTPSLLSADFYARLFSEVTTICEFEENIEITLEANPGTVEHGLFSDYLAAGINRLSLGIQSFDNQQLQKLGRVHDARQAHFAIESAQKAGFSNLNLDIMHSLPGQTFKESLADLQTALSFAPQHLSWYQLTIEPNTVFYKTKPTLPSDEQTLKVEEQGLVMLSAAGFGRYEISAYAKPDYSCQHNLNYWLFGDYFGIGAGAHGKFTDIKQQKVYRSNKYRLPRDYLNMSKGFIANTQIISAEDLVFEFMLNATRLEQKIPLTLFTSNTLLPYNFITDKLQKAAGLGLIDLQDDYWQVTAFGRRYTNNLQEIFLP